MQRCATPSTQFDTACKFCVVTHSLLRTSHCEACMEKQCCLTSTWCVGVSDVFARSTNDKQPVGKAVSSAVPALAEAPASLGSNRANLDYNVEKHRNRRASRGQTVSECCGEKLPRLRSYEHANSSTADPAAGRRRCRVQVPAEAAESSDVTAAATQEAAEP